MGIRWLKQRLNIPSVPLEQSYLFGDGLYEHLIILFSTTKETKTPLLLDRLLVWMDCGGWYSLDNIIKKNTTKKKQKKKKKKKKKKNK